MPHVQKTRARARTPRRLIALALVSSLLLGHGAFAQGNDAKALPAEQLQVPDGFEVRTVVDGLDFPVAIEWDDDGTLYVGTSGWAYGLKNPLPAQVLRVSEDGTTIVVADGFDTPLNDITWHDGWLYVSHRGAITRIDPSTDAREDIAANLPSFGDHHNNEIVFGPDGRLYWGQGTATNSGVVGLDNLRTGWVKNITEGSDVPCEDVTLSGANYVTDNPWMGARDFDHFEPARVVYYNDSGEIPESAKGVTGANVTTGPYVPFGTPTFKGQTITGQVPCNGAVLSVKPDGSDMQWYAWGLRNPFGLAFDDEGGLWVVENMYDTRGSRPVANVPDIFRKVEEGEWYGFPDHWTDQELDQERFSLRNDRIPVLLFRDTPENAADAGIALPTTHSGTTKFDFAPGEPWGDASTVYLAEFGDMTPVTGPKGITTGMAVTRFPAESPGEAEIFLVAKERGNGTFRPVEAKFGADDALYVVHIAKMPVVMQGGLAAPNPMPGTGAVYAVSATPAAGDDEPPTGDEDVGADEGAEEAQGDEDDDIPVPAIVPVLAMLLGALLVTRSRRRG